MGIVNTTPDSFSDGGCHLTVEAAVRQAAALVAAGATIIDLGAESTRPGAGPVSEEEEGARLLPALRAVIASQFGVAISVDTRRASIAKAALELGAHIINDVGGAPSAAMLSLARETCSPLVILHGYSNHTSASAAALPASPRAAAEAVFAALKEQARRAEQAGLPSEQIWLDPGLGFGKTAKESAACLLSLSSLTAERWPILIGPSRKRFLREGAGNLDWAAADQATGQACAVAIALGASIVRLHSPAVLAPVRRLVALATGDATDSPADSSFVASESSNWHIQGPGARSSDG